LTERRLSDKRPLVLPIPSSYPTSASRAAANDYTRHRPEHTVLYAALQENWKTFVAELEVSYGWDPDDIFGCALQVTGGTPAPMNELYF
jgi:hypothetical protein